MRNSLKFVSKIVLVTLIATSCKKGLIEPVLEKSTVAFLSGNTGWNGPKPASNQQWAKANNSFDSKRATLNNREASEVMVRSIIGHTVFEEKNGRKRYVQELPSGRLNVALQDKDGNFLGTMKNWSLKDVNDQARDEHWSSSARNWLDRHDY